MSFLIRKEVLSLDGREPIPVRFVVGRLVSTINTISPIESFNKEDLLSHIPLLPEIIKGPNRFFECDVLAEVLEDIFDVRYTDGKMSFTPKSEFEETIFPMRYSKKYRELKDPVAHIQSELTSRFAWLQMKGWEIIEEKVEKEGKVLAKFRVPLKRVFRNEPTKSDTLPVTLPIRFMKEGEKFRVELTADAVHNLIKLDGTINEHVIYVAVNTQPQIGNTPEDAYNKLIKEMRKLFNEWDSKVTEIEKKIRELPSWKYIITPNGKMVFGFHYVDDLIELLIHTADKGIFFKIPYFRVRALAQKAVVQTLELEPIEEGIYPDIKPVIDGNNLPNTHKNLNEQNWTVLFNTFDDLILKELREQYENFPL